MSNASNDLVLHLKLDTIIPDGGNQRVRSALTENFLASSENVSAFTESQYRSHGNPQFVSDEHFGSCFIFDGRQDYIEIPNSEDINFATNQDFTVASWIKIAKEQPFKTNGDNDIIEKWNGSGGYPYVIRYLRNEQRIHAARYDGSNNPAVTTTTQLNSEQLYHIAFVKEGSKLRLYLDGREENSTDDTTQSQTQNDSPLYLARRGGSNEAYANYFAGTIAHLRIYNKALSPEEIKRDMNDDLTAIAAFNLAYPLDFNLYEGEDQKSVIFIENDTKGEELVFEIQNDTEQEINLPAKSGAVTQNNYHFELRFRPDTLSPKSLQQLALKTQSNWSMSSPVTQADGIVSLYFLTTNTTLSANEVVTLTLPNVSASAAGGARTTRVEFLCPEFTYQGETLTHYYREKKLSVIDHRGKKNIPLHVSFVGSNRILNDGTTTNKLTLRIVNVLKDKSIPLIPDSKGDNASKFIISFDVQEEGQNKDWALGTTSQVAGISIKYKGKEIINSGQQGESPEWVILFNDQTAIEPSQDIQVELSGIVSSLPSGQTNLYIRYENIPGYWDGTFVCTIEKSPIVFDTNDNVGIGTTSPNQKLQVTGGNAAINNVFLGDVGHGDNWAGFSHINSIGQNSYAFLQNISGTFTLINKKPGVDGYIGFRVDNQDKMVILDNGNVGIGTTSPTNGKLHIEGSSRFKIPIMSLRVPTEAALESPPISLYATESVYARDIHQFSDARIKEIYDRSDSQTDLKTLLQIEVTDYSYRDKIANGNRQHKKVIGQQVAKVFPQAVSIHTDVVCDIFQFAPLSDGWVTLTNHGLKTGERVKLLWEENNSEVFPVEAVTPDTFQIDLEYCGNILVYGREVKDFHVADYDALSMLHLSATQALYEIISKLQQEVETLKQQ
ncbi:MAG: hypothetical protein EWV85_14825 [Microcystis aeruginosa Ma_QC_C_20070703_M131]|uniref:Peptidase S74 domain-containing protein n=1 Tax=Microcystis aeruginosa Ma_QC_C_20070703_M131 TaxID=2486263 RepID=A0A551XVZ8_MICAE|nr:MAG: hypothetical protein EWV85_14825 [Microcystis aeruginosa Ma_QC_C_20070703_M131]